MNDSRYIIEFNLAAQFEIARSTTRFSSLLGLFPPVFVGRPAELKKIVRVMCRTMKQSMKSTDMAMPPWRRNSYMQCKWLGSYRRTTNNAPTKNGIGIDECSVRRAVGFVASPVGAAYFRCRNEFMRDVPMRVGQLTATFSDQLGHEY